MLKRNRTKKAFVVYLLNKTITKLFEAKIQHTKMHIVLPQVYKSELRDLSLIYFPEALKNLKEQVKKWLLVSLFVVLLLRGLEDLSGFFFLNFIKPEYESRSLQQSKGLVQQKTTPQPLGMEPHVWCHTVVWELVLHEQHSPTVLEWGLD